jgi:hypothetical protein
MSSADFFHAIGANYFALSHYLPFAAFSGT